MPKLSKTNPKNIAQEVEKKKKITPQVALKIGSQIAPKIIEVFEFHTIQVLNELNREKSQAQKNTARPARNSQLKK